MYTLKVGFQMDSAIKYKEGKGFRVNPFRLSDTLFIYMYINQIINLNNCDSCIYEK